MFSFYATNPLVMNLPKLAVGRPVTTLMALVSVLVLGGVAWSRLPLAFLPEVDAPFIGIQIPYPSSNPTQVEKEIAKPVEEALSTLSGVKKLRSRSTADGAEINMQFDWGKDLDVVRMQVALGLVVERALLHRRLRAREAERGAERSSGSERSP